MVNELLVFEVAEQRIGFPAQSVLEVVLAVTLSPFPQAPEGVAGLLNFRGRVLPVLDMRSLLQLPPKDLEQSDHLIVVDAGVGVFALKVDRAIDLLVYSEDDVQTVHALTSEFPKANGDESPHLFGGTAALRSVVKSGETIVHLLDLSLLFSTPSGAQLVEAVSVETTESSC